MNENRRHHDEAAPDRDLLASLLRDADPAAGATRLDAVERARMRQAITEAADGHAGDGLWSAAWQGWERPALAAAALITVVGLALWALDRNPEDPSTEIAGAGVAPLEPAPETAARAPSPERTPVATPVPPPENTAVAAVNDPPPPHRRTRTMRFTAPRGTRIIWTLDPDFESPIAEREARQEQAQ